MILLSLFSSAATRTRCRLARRTISPVAITGISVNGAPSTRTKSLW